MTLKELISEKHKLAENNIFNVKMMRGNLTVPEYVLYLFQQREIFKKLEENELPHPGLNRLDNITSDIFELNSRHDSIVIVTSTQQYVSYLDNMTSEERLPHIYLNYMALLFGGQLLKKILPGPGLLYNFSNTKEIIRSMRDIQMDSWADEVNRGFDFIIGIFDELQQLSEQSSESL